MILTIVTDYVSKSNMYTNGFVHAREKEYIRNNIDTKVFVLNDRKKRETYEIEGVHVIVGNSKDLIELIKNDTSINCVCFHFLSAKMVKAYKRFNRPVKAIAFVHGNEALWWYQRIFPDRFSGFVRILKFIKYVILNSYNMIYMRNKLNKLDISLVFVSDWMKKQTIKNWNLKSNSYYYIIPYIVNNLIFPYREKSNEKKYNFLMIRQFTSGKYALDVAMDIIKELQAYPENDKFKFTIIGDGWLFEKYTSRVSMFSNVEIKRTFLSQNDISKYHNENGFFICPTRQDAQGVSMCEAMSSGLIPISSNNTAIPEFLPEKYNLCFDNAKDSAKRIIEIINNETEFKKLSEECSKFIQEKCSSEKTTKKEIELMSSFSNLNV